MRGRTFKNALIIADEMQNSSPSQMLMIATRLGSRSKLIITGDLKQSDRMEDNGLKDFLQKKREYDKKLDQSHQNTTDISITQFDEGDIQRSKIVTEVLKIYGEIEYEKIDQCIPPDSKTVPLISNTEKVRRLSREIKSKSDAAIISLSDMKRASKNTKKK
jgi:phosphate starvation-inducible protein PhoH